MPGSPYRTSSRVAAPMPVAYQTDDSAIPMIAVAILFAALAPPLSVGVLGIWDALRPDSGAVETRVPTRRVAPDADR